jgi:tRNA-intron endonuclease
MFLNGFEMAIQMTSKAVVKAEQVGERVLTESTNEARELYDKNRFGSVLENGKVQLSLMEALYLVEKNRIQIKEGRKKVKFEDFLKKAQSKEAGFWVKYCVYKDLRIRGYIVKTALKFGADFRVYDRGVKPGEDHARWVVFPVHENSALTWHEFAAKNRVAHSTKKRLLIGIVDEENSVTYYEIRWVRP